MSPGLWLHCCQLRYNTRFNRSCLGGWVRWARWEYAPPSPHICIHVQRISAFCLHLSLAQRCSGVSVPACSLQVNCVLETVDGLLNALQKAYSARLTAGLPGRRCLWTSHWVSQTFTLWIKQSYSDVKLSVCICITICFTHCVITSRRSAGTENVSLTAEDVIYLFHGRSNKMWSVQQTDEVVCPNNMWRPYGWLYWETEKVYKLFILSPINVRHCLNPLIMGHPHASTADCVCLPYVDVTVGGTLAVQFSFSLFPNLWMNKIRNER